MGFFRSSAVVAAVAAAAMLMAQEPTFRVDVRLVRLLATVKDVHGSTVGSLNKGDFTVWDNGVKQEIALFERHTAQPLSVAILLDISGSTGRAMKYQTDAVQRFVEALFGEGNPDDTASLFTFNWAVTQSVGYTRNPERFRTAIRNLKAEAGTSLYDAIFLASNDIASRDGRHVLVIVTDGGDTISSTSYQRALEAAHAADAVLYPILTVPVKGDAGRNVGGENALTTLSQTTGGRMFSPGENGLNYAFDEILRDLRTQYLIGFYPRGVPPAKNRFHKIDIRVARPDLRVVSRTGYYGDSEPSSRP